MALVGPKISSELHIIIVCVVVVLAGIDIRRELNQRGCEKTAETRWPARRPKPRRLADRGRRRPDDAHARRRLRVRAAHRLRLRGVGQRRLPNPGGGRDATRGLAGHRHRALRTSSTSRWPPGGQRRRRRTSASQRQEPKFPLVLCLRL